MSLLFAYGINRFSHDRLLTGPAPLQVSPLVGPNVGKLDNDIVLVDGRVVSHGELPLLIY